MKKKLMLVLLALALLVPGWSQAAVEAGAGNITLLAHIDFVGRYSAEDDSNGWSGYETYNLEFAVLGIAGQLGDNVDWVITNAFTFMPYGSAYSALANGAGTSNEMTTSTLLDARINVHLGEALMLSAGRFIPPSSMTWAPHQMKNLHTVNYPLINGSGLGAGALMLPLPMYQTGVMATAMLGPVSIQLASVNGSDIAAGPEVLGGIAFNGLNNMVDIDKTKGFAGKVAVDMEGFHFGGWYYGETASIVMANGSLDGQLTTDAQITQWGAELGLTTDMFLLQAQYLTTTLDPMDTGADDLLQNGWYVLAGVNVGPAQIVGRYDMVNADQDNVLISSDFNEESAVTAGINFMINDNTTAGLDYTWRDLENVDANTDELAFILEVDLF